jgi:hypothetical protein
VLVVQQQTNLLWEIKEVTQYLIRLQLLEVEVEQISALMAVVAVLVLAVLKAFGRVVLPPRQVLQGLLDMVMLAVLVAHINLVAAAVVAVLVVLDKLITLAEPVVLVRQI